MICTAVDLVCLYSGSSAFCYAARLVLLVPTALLGVNFPHVLISSLSSLARALFKMSFKCQSVSSTLPIGNAQSTRTNSWRCITTRIYSGSIVWHANSLYIGESTAMVPAASSKRRVSVSRGSHPGYVIRQTARYCSGIWVSQSTHPGEEQYVLRIPDLSSKRLRGIDLVIGIIIVKPRLQSLLHP